MAPTTRPIGCAEKAKMFSELSAAMASMLALNSRELEAVIAGQLNRLETIQAQLQRARLHKDSMLTAYRDHVETHGC